MYCKYCGKQIEDGSNFCKYCGASLTDDIQGKQEAPSTPISVYNMPPITPKVTPSAPVNVKINDEGIKALISQHRGIIEADTPYFYGYILPTGLLFLFGAIASFAFKYYILNFNAQGLHLYQLGLSTKLKVKEYSFIPEYDIKRVKMTNGLLQWHVKIEYQQNGKIKILKVKANKKIIGINEQLPNLERVKLMFNQ